MKLLQQMDGSNMYTMLSEGSQIQTHRLHTVAFILARAGAGSWGWWRLDVRVAGGLGEGLFCTMKLECVFVCGAAFTQLSVSHRTSAGIEHLRVNFSVQNCFN